MAIETGERPHLLNGETAGPEQMEAVHSVALEVEGPIENGMLSNPTTNGGDQKNKNNEKLQKKYTRVKEQLEKLKTQRTDKDENKQIALGTSKLNYLDPRISVAWCKKYDVPVEKIFSKTQRDKFRWAIDMAKEDFIF